MKISIALVLLGGTIVFCGSFFNLDMKIFL